MLFLYKIAKCAVVDIDDTFKYKFFIKDNICADFRRCYLYIKINFFNISLFDLIDEFALYHTESSYIHKIIRTDGGWLSMFNAQTVEIPIKNFFKGLSAGRTIDFMITLCLNEKIRTMYKKMLHVALNKRMLKKIKEKFLIDYIIGFLDGFNVNMEIYLGFYETLHHTIRHSHSESHMISANTDAFLTEIRNYTDIRVIHFYFKLDNKIIDILQYLSVNEPDKYYSNTESSGVMIYDSFLCKLATQKLLKSAKAAVYTLNIINNYQKSIDLHTNYEEGGKIVMYIDKIPANIEICLIFV